MSNKSEKRTFNMKNLAGLFPRFGRVKEEEKLKLEKDLAEAAAARGLKASDNWPIVKLILDELKDEAVNKTSQRNAPDKELRWANNRFETIDQFYEKLETKIKKGISAQPIYSKLKEKENGRPTSKTG